MEKETPIFADGFYPKYPDPRTKERAPWVKALMPIQVEQAIEFLKKNANDSGFVNLELKKSKKTGNLYLQVNTWQPKPVTPEGTVKIDETLEPEVTLEPPTDTIKPEDLEF